MSGFIKTLLLLATLSVSFSDPFVTRVQELQLPSGGFRDVSSELPSLESTSQALFLVSLYGIRTQINADDALQYVQGLQTDEGFSATTGVQSDLESTRYALYSFRHLGKEVPQAEKIGDFVRSLAGSNGLFSSRKGDGSDIRSTVAAVEILDILGQLNRPDVQPILAKIKEYIAERVVEEAELKRFVFDTESKNEIAENYYGVYLASKVGFELTEPKKWVSYIAQFQSFDRSGASLGGFYGSSTRVAATAESTAHAVLSLYLIGGSIAEVERYVVHYALKTKTSLKDATFSHLAISHTSLFKKSFSPIVKYNADGEFLSSDQIKEGVSVTPVARIPMLDGLVSSGAFKIFVKESGGWKSELVFDVNTLIYVSKKEFDTTGKFGNVKFSYEFKTNVYPIGDLLFSSEDEKRVGFEVNLDQKVSFGGRNLDEGEKVIPGTDFEFGLTFATQSNPSFFSGDFILDFSVVDSSGVVHHHESHDGSQTSKPVVLAYTLTGADFTSGEVTFLFEVRNSQGVHTVKKSVHFLEQQMVASHIEFEKGKIRLGDSFVVSMQPASLKDLHTVEPFSATHASKRSFAMDISSLEGKVYLSVPSENDGSSSKYTFKTQIPATLDFVGGSVISFRFVGSSGDSVKLQAFDVSSNELYDDASPLQFSVSTELHLSNVQEQPTTKEFTYGSVIPFKFQIQDVLSGSFVSTGEKSKVEIVLRSGDVNPFESLRKELGLIKGVYETSLEVDVNTVQGSAVIAIVASNPDGQDIPVYVEGQKNVVGYPVNIGGEIKVESNTYSTSTNDAPKTAFVVKFSLSCNGKSLDNARLVGSVLSHDGSKNTPVSVYGRELVRVPVASGDSSTYSFSFTLTHEQAKSGNYKLDFTREVDLLRAQASKESEVKPLFTVSVSHKQVAESGLWVRMEFLVVLALLALLVYVSNQKKLFHQKSA